MSLPEHHDSSRMRDDEKQIISRKSCSTPSSQQSVPRIQISIPKTAVGNETNHSHHSHQHSSSKETVKLTPAAVRSTTTTTKPSSTWTTSLSSAMMPSEVSPTPVRTKHNNNNNSNDNNNNKNVSSVMPAVSNTAGHVVSIDRSTSTTTAPPTTTTMTTTIPQPTQSNNNTSDCNPKKKTSSNNNNKKDWPTHSARALPHLSSTVLQRLQEGTLSFPSNAEPCALKLSPTGRLLAVAYNDGTLRLYDLTGRFSHSNQHQHHVADTNNNKSSSSSSSSPQLSSSPRSTAGRPARPFVSSNTFQKYGAVAAQIHAKGVHTSLLMNVDVSPDGLWFFCGALRGSMELVAVHVGDLEAELSKTTTKANSNNNMNLLDLMTVYRHSDAKLRGFSACTAVQASSPNNTTTTTTKRQQYLLLTGRGIKNCHVWRFDPSRQRSSPSGSDSQQAILFEKIMDVPTNGNSIKFLNFRRKKRSRRHKQQQNANTTADTTKQQQHSLLQIVSKSDDLKVRLWTLPSEAHIAAAPPGHVFARPSRYYDVPHTESALGVAGGAFALCGGGHDSFNQISIVSLQQQQQQQSNKDSSNNIITEAYCNVMELALPNTTTPGSNVGSSGGGRVGSRRSQRGDLKSITSVEGMTTDAGHALLEVSDGRLVHYYSCPRDGMMPTLQRMESPDGFGPLPEGTSRKLTVGRVGAQGIAVAAVATFRSATTKGRIRLYALEDVVSEEKMRKGFWGFLGTPLRLVDGSADTAEESKKVAAETRADASKATAKEVKKVAARTETVGENIKNAKEASPAVLNAAKVHKQSDPSLVTPYPSGPDRRLKLLALASTSISKEMRPLARQLATSTPFAKASNNGASHPDERILLHIPTQGTDERKPPYKETASTPVLLGKKSSTFQKQKRSVSDAPKTSSDIEPSLKRQRLSAEDLLPLRTAKPQVESAGLDKRCHSFEKLPSSETPKKRAKTIASSTTQSLPKALSTEISSTQTSKIMDAPQVSTPKPSPNIPRKRPSLDAGNQAARTVASTPVSVAVERSTLPNLVRSPKAAFKASSRKEDSYPLRCIVVACDEQLEKLQTLLSQVSQRRLISPEVRRSDDSIISLLTTEREKLVAEHRAAHDFVWKRVLRVTIALVKSLKASPTRSALNESRSTLEEELEEFRDIVESMLTRQEMEAIALVARQRHELCYHNQDVSPESIPDIVVSFAYPNMLQQVLDLFPSPTLV